MNSRTVRETRGDDVVGEKPPLYSVVDEYNWPIFAALSVVILLLIGLIVTV